MIESKHVIICDEFLFNTAINSSQEETYPIAVYDEFDEAQKAMMELTEEQINKCNEGEYSELEEFNVTTTKHWCSIDSKHSAHYISFRLCSVPYNAVKFEEDNLTND